MRATEIPLETATAAGDVIRLARRIVDGANVNALADVAAAVASARAALEAARCNVEANLTAITDPSCGKELSDKMTAVATLAVDAERLIEDIRARIRPAAR